MESYRDNLEIDLKDLASKIMKKWGLILLGAIICAGLGIGYSLITGSKLSPASAAPTNNTLNDQKEELKRKLTAKEARDVELAYKAFVECEKLYAETSGTENEIELLKATQQVLAIKSIFSSDQQMYYSALFEEEDNAVSPAFSKKINEGFSPDSQNKLSVKFIIIAALAGALAVISVIAAKYVLTPVLKTEDDLRNAFKLPIISSFRTGDEATLEYVYNSICACAKKSDVQKICILGSVVDPSTSEYKHKVSDMFSEKDLSANASDFILDDPKVLEEIVNSDGVMLFEKIGKSKYEDIAKEIERCKNFGVKILGAIVVE